MAKCDGYYQHGLEFRCYSMMQPKACHCGGDTEKCDLYPERRRKMVMGMNKCGDCLYFDFCAQWVDKEETFPEIEGGCTVFKNKDAFVEVVRCKNCKYYREGKIWDGIKFCFRLRGDNGEPVGYNYCDDDFCSYGERKDNERTD